jgi:hypothetical protein
MKMDRSSSVTFDINPEEAREVVEKVRQLPDMSSDALNAVGFMYDMSAIIASGNFEEFTFIVRVRRAPK